jgi:uncharacterized membrane protein
MPAEATKIILYIVSVIGLLDTSYLIYHKLAGTDVDCLFFPKKWCTKVQYSKFSKTFGVPNPVWGFLMYAAILVLTYMVTQGSASFNVVKGIVTFGFLFSMYFTFIQAFVLRAFCTWCVVSALNFVVMFLAVWIIG